MSRERLLDAALAAVALGAVLLAAALADVRAHPVGLVAGAGGSILLEAILQRWRVAVRRAWARTGVKAAAGLAFLAALGAAASLAPAWGLSLLAGGLLAYLSLLAGAAIGAALRE